LLEKTLLQIALLLDCNVSLQFSSLETSLKSGILVFDLSVELIFNLFVDFFELSKQELFLFISVGLCDFTLKLTSLVN